MDTHANTAAPADGRQLGQVETTPPQAVQAAVDRARAALAQWRRVPAAERARRLERAAELIASRRDELGPLLARESGKPLAQAAFEVGGAANLLRGNAEEARRIAGRTLPMEGNPGTEADLAYTRREPLGVIAAILPFNFPVELLVEKCGAALAGGNAVVCKAPAEDPLTVQACAEALWEAGVPAAALQLLHGGADVGAALADAEGVDAISLTGSTGAGIAVARAAAPRLRRLHLELGGNNATLVLADADLDLVEREVVFGRLLANGQACSASKRVLADRSLHDELVERLAAAARRQVVGDPLDERTTVGPLITASAAERVAGQVERALADGGALAAGRARAEGAFFEPAVVGGLPAEAAVMRDDEIFGPVFAVAPVDGPDQAVELANASDFGLMASVFSADLELAVHLAERLEAGGVVINGTDNYRPPVIPFGGVKLSGQGREGLGYTLNELTREKVIVLRRFRRRSLELEQPDG